MPGIETFIDVGQVAEMLGLSVATIRRWVLTGYIPTKKSGGRFVFRLRKYRAGRWEKA